jgi:hypothetical protein
MAEFTARMPAAPAQAADTLSVAETRPVPPARVPTRRLRGRISTRFLMVATDGDSLAGPTRVVQPALDLRAEGPVLPCADVAVDVRSRLTSRTDNSVKTTESAARVYRAALTTHDVTGHYRMTVGRQASSALSTVSIFDGALVEFDGEQRYGGLFGGVQPEPTRLGLSGAISQYGAFAGLRQRAGSERRWNVTMGGISSWEAGQPNREFLFAQSSYLAGGFAAFWLQEADVNRGWRRAPGDPGFSPTSTFLSVRAPVGRRVIVSGGYDGRRNVRLYRDRETPETQFDDRFRQGGWVGASVEPQRHVRVSADLRQNWGEVDPSTSWSAGVELLRLPWVQSTVRGRAAAYRGDLTQSRLLAFGLGATPFGSLHLETSGGQRQTTDHLSGIEELDYWQDLTLDLSVGRRCYLSANSERDHGDSGGLWQHTLGLSWRF